MKYGLNLELTYEYKRFSFNSRSNKFTHNETGFTRKAVLDYFGNKLISYAVEINKKKYLKGVYNDLNELLGIFYKEKIGPNEPDRKFFITKYQRIIDDITIKIISNPYNINDDFDFDELDELAIELTGVSTKASNSSDTENLDELFSSGFDFGSTEKSNNDDIPMLTDFVKTEAVSEQDKVDCSDDFNFDDLEDKLPVRKPTKKTTNKDDFDFSEFDEMDAEEPLTNAPTFMFSGAGYTLYISFNHMTFKATGGDENVVYALQNLATLVFINHTFLTAKNHPEWLYSSFEDDLKQIFDKLTTGLTYFNDKERDIADCFLESSMYHAVLNYRNRLGYYKYHKPFVFEHE
ncbi:hypothetical protein [Pseudomonas carnis]|uniref:hypothetical protein n=1 Tax=Pseudomonas carnis TaxID=2487355 RepID=UPI001D6517BB|nr:hypothetical protein [Pseudomonas carnis]CAH0136032.1 hypothetical protein SRABI111_00340 [Pseudomonas carnis]CAH0139020.1 hypothetical protein SRABI110_00484 [Pseudomonas carnis]CAH0158077.1 hypothetical protein SRABI64_00708 [Pseudomonas carnis]CAH0202109.1 hypothetical protein SRABI08_01918 [Pseudomonas carnis]